MDKPIIIAICGKSASGKDTLANWMIGDFKYKNIPVNKIVSYTTRPPRMNEKNGEDYYFISAKEFLNEAEKGNFLEYSRFRGWHYGTNKKTVLDNKINIGVFNMDGIKSLLRRKNDYKIIVIYLEESLFYRLQRSRDRENTWKIEFFRRAFVDWIDFKDIRYFLNGFTYKIHLKNIDNVIRKTNIVEKYLQNIGIID